ncbi:hypothetical protein [Streptomyces sp. Ag109_O5-10]|uniref:hypothetical protein n=1 Tax=Streptomyces sp. Ag109_O5-10 TaxID=1855349 RepID=UPI00089B3D85|nr:hypothetical protein [Streptomyces sp. Ag109_O5-10]SEF07487.1 hypothetical protein SAMN05216533_5918 [Streptomyces sp. Ag109_O5-10]
MTHSEKPVPRRVRSVAVSSRHTCLADIDPYEASASRDAHRVIDVPDHRANRSVTFNSAA